MKSLSGGRVQTSGVQPWKASCLYRYNLLHAGTILMTGSMAWGNFDLVIFAIRCPQNWSITAILLLNGVPEVSVARQ